SQAASPRDRLDQLADAVHAQGDLCPVPAAAPRSAYRQEKLRIFLLQSGPGTRQRGLRRALGAPQAELAAGKNHRAMDPALHAGAAQATNLGLTGMPPAESREPKISASPTKVRCLRSSGMQCRIHRS